ncbi:hypothetical protein COCCU_14075 [Corynebacterium occultum]|uniref:Uncharacterized protein n=1 Tax=Corynebacterium occultum TaxID=2675219 RepID=A0A6B8WBL6_9CORY|nr:hypothetical protein [Corynebacterium occultum]QGU08705.1 hypothetical protein COCCU_14075 [Corynebacterium occultum]
MGARLYPINQQHLGLLHPRAARSVFWECDAATATSVHASGDPLFEKSAWLATTTHEYGCCGYSIAAPSPLAPAALESVFGTVLYCGRDKAPGAEQLPSGPVSEDAEIITSLFIDAVRSGEGMEAVLIDAAIMELMAKDVSAVEAFGLREDYIEDPDQPMDTQLAELVAKAGDIGLINFSVLESAGFQVIREHPVIPRLRLEIPPPVDLLAKLGISENLEKVGAC